MPKKPKDKIVYARLTPEAHKAITAIVSRNLSIETMSAFVRIAVMEKLERMEKNNGAG